MQQYTFKLKPLVIEAENYAEAHNKLKAFLRAESPPIATMTTKDIKPAKKSGQETQMTIAGLDEVTDTELDGEIVFRRGEKVITAKLMFGPPDHTGVIVDVDGTISFEDDWNLMDKLRCKETDWQWMAVSDWRDKVVKAAEST